MKFATDNKAIGRFYRACQQLDKAGIKLTSHNISRYMNNSRSGVQFNKPTMKRSCELFHILRKLGLARLEGGEWKLIIAK